MANNVDPDETARYYEPYLDLNLLEKYIYWSEGDKRFKNNPY